MLGEVCEVLRVERRQRQALNQAAGSNPCVVDGPGAAPALCPSLQLAPGRRDRIIKRQPSRAKPSRTDSLNRSDGCPAVTGSRILPVPGNAGR